MKNMIALAAELEREDHPAAKIVLTAIEKSNSPKWLAAVAAAMYDAAVADIDDEKRIEASVLRSIRSAANFDVVEETFNRR
jgi:hypothetical protein